MTPKHRHLVAAPMAILGVLTVMGLSALIPVRAELSRGVPMVHLSAPSADQVFNVGRGVAGVLRVGSFLSADHLGSRLTLKSGQVLLRTTELFTLEFGGEISVVSVDGAFVAVRDPDAITIAALDAPLLYTSGTSAILLGAGEQVRLQIGKTDHRSAIGGEWYVSQLTDLALLRRPDRPVFGSDRLSSALSVRDGAACTEIVTQEHVSKSDLRSALALLLDSGKITNDLYICIRSISEQLDLPPMLRRLVSLILMAEGARTDHAASEMILEDLHNDPTLRSLTFEVLPVLISTNPKTLQPAFVESFPKSVIEIGLVNSARAISILRGVVSFPRTFLTAGLPLQSEAWKSAITRAIIVLKTTVPDAESGQFDALLADVLRAPAPPKEKQSVQVATASPVTTTTNWTAEQLHAITHDVLVTHGVLLAVTSVFSPDTETQTVRVDGVFIHENGQNVPYTFIYDPTKESVTKIVRDGRRFPNAVPVKTFFRQ